MVPLRLQRCLAAFERLGDRQVDPQKPKGFWGILDCRVAPPVESAASLNRLLERDRHVVETEQIAIVRFVPVVRFGFDLEAVHRDAAFAARKAESVRLALVVPFRQC